MRSAPARRPFIHVDPGAGERLQAQMCDAIRRAIAGGSLPPGARLPSSRELAADVGVSRTTALLVYEQLGAEGYLTTRPGLGTFVERQLPDERPPAEVVPAARRAFEAGVSARGAALAAIPPAAVRLGAGVRPFRIGVPALDCFPLRLWTELATRRLRTATTAELDYGDPAGERRLREAIATHVSAARGTVCSADQVLIVAGAQQGLQIACRALLDPGDPCVVEDPGYPGAWSACLAAGAGLHPAAVDEQGLVVAAARRAVPAPRLVYVTPSHQFPTGVPMSLARRRELLLWARDAGAWIVEDDYDSEYRHGARPIPCLHGLDPDGRVIYVGSFSKTLFPSLRLGFLILPAGIERRCAAMRAASDLHPPVLDQLVVADLIADGHYERHLRRMRGVYRERLEALIEAADQYCGDVLRVAPVQTGLHAVANLAADIDAAAAATEAARLDVELMPLAAYAAVPSRGAGALVLGFGGMDAAGVRDGMKRLGRALRVSRAGRHGTP
jgi:GntR family transcriptional regulator/MocR family aminotransferase